MTRMMPRTIATTSRTGIYHTSYVRISAHALFASVLFMVCWPVSKAAKAVTATSVIRSIANWIALTRDRRQRLVYPQSARERIVDDARGCRLFVCIR